MTTDSLLTSVATGAADAPRGDEPDHV